MRHYGICDLRCDCIYNFFFNLGCAFKSFTAQNRFDNEFIFWRDKHLGIGELCEKDNDACIDLPFRHLARIWIFAIN